MKKIIILIMILVLSSITYGALTDDLIGAYHLSDNTAEVGQDFTEFNVPAYTTGFNGNAVSCPDGYLTDSGDYYGTRLSSEGTMSWWTSYSGTVANGYAFCARGSGDRLYSRDVNGQFHFDVGDGNPPEGSADYYGFSLNSWYFHTLIWNSSGTFWYINGTLQGSGTETFNPNGWDNDFTMCSYCETAGYPVTGLIDEFYIWNRSLSGTEIADLFNSGDGFFYPFTTPDTTPPTYTNFQDNATDTILTDIVNASVVWTDDIELDICIFAHNQSGTMTNVTSTVLTGTTDTCVGLISITLDGGDIGYQFWANDTSNNINVTGIGVFNVTPSNNILIFGITDPTTSELTINFTSRGDIYGRHAYFESVTEGSQPLIIDNDIAYAQLMDLEFDTIDKYHNTAPSETKNSYGVSVTQLLKYTIKGIQYIESKINLLKDNDKVLKDITDNINNENNKQDRTIKSIQSLEENNPLHDAIQVDKFNDTTGNHTIIDTDIGMFDAVYTKSQVPNIGEDYCKMYFDYYIFNKTTHFGYKEVMGKGVLTGEGRQVVTEGCMMQLLLITCKDKKEPFCP